MGRALHEPNPRTPVQQSIRRPALTQGMRLRIRLCPDCLHQAPRLELTAGDTIEVVQPTRCINEEAH